MQLNRRDFVKKILTLAVSGFTLGRSFMQSAVADILWNKESFQAANYEETLNLLFKDAEFISSPKIKFNRLPWIAENGAAVPVKVICNLDNVSKISILVEKNPHPLIAEFYLSPEVDPVISARIKMAESSHVIAIAEVDGQFYRHMQFVKVTEGGCG